MKKENYYSYKYGSFIIDYLLLFDKRKNMEISVHPDASVLIKAPYNTDMESIEKRIRKRARWILKQQDYFNQFIPRTPEKIYKNGETHLYFGKHYRLNIKKGPISSVKLEGSYFQIISDDICDSLKIKNLLYDWYYKKSENHFHEIYNKIWSAFNFKDKEIPELKIVPLTNKWGSMSKGNIISVNIELIKSPVDYIEYVLTHELCHLVHKNHSRDFYRLLESYLPDWKIRKHRLELFLS